MISNTCIHRRLTVMRRYERLTVENILKKDIFSIQIHEFTTDDKQRFFSTYITILLAIVSTAIADNSKHTSACF